MEERAHESESKTRRQSHRQVRSTVDHAASNLDEFVASMTPNVERYRTFNRAMFESLGQAFRAGKEAGAPESVENRQALASLLETIQVSQEHAMNFQASVSRIPALTGKFKRSRKRAAAVLGELVAEMSFSLHEAHSLLEEMGGEPIQEGDGALS